MNWKVIAKCLKLAKEFNNETPIDTEHFSFIVRKNHIESIGWNLKEKTHPIADKFNYRWPTVHSELSSILNYDGNFNKVYMVNIRISKGGRILIAKPCKHCQELLLHYGIDKVIYSTEFGFKRWQHGF